MMTDHTLIADVLAEQGYLIIKDFLPQALVEQLYDHVTALPETAFQSAKVGRQQSSQQLDTVRNDRTVWLSEDHPVEQAYLEAMAELQMQLNHQLFLGLRDFEAHFAHYPPGHFYQRHIDAFRGQSNRKVSSVLYLTPDWSADDGGELVIYDEDEERRLHTVTPQMGSLVLFLSENFPHEVLAAKRDRYSIAGWFRTDTHL